MSEVKEPRDCLGNIITKDAYFSLHMDRPMIFKVIAVENGGLHTAHGMTPSMVRLVRDITLRSMPGMLFVSLVKVVDPTQQQLIDSVAAKLPL
jgi:hypothetical protein